MKTSDTLRRAGQNLRQSKARTILTSLAIAVGAFTIALALGSYTNEMVEASGDAYSLSVYPRYEEADAPEGLPEYGVEEDDTSEQAISVLTNDDMTKLHKLDGVESITPMLDISSRYMTRGGEHKKLVAPLSVKVDRTEMKLAAGSLDENMLQAGEATMSESFVTQFGFKDADDAIGKTIHINVPKLNADQTETEESRDFTVRIAAVDRASDTTLYYQEAIRISGEDSQKIYAYQYGSEAGGRYYGLVVLARSGTDVPALQQVIQDEGYQVYSLEDERAALLQVINIAQWGLAGFGALAILASIFGIINTQYISVLERTQQIGLMKALGARRKDIGRLFRFEAAWIGFLGGLIGVVLAYLVTLLNPIIATVLELEESTRLLQMDWLASVLLVAGLMIVAVASGYFPARKAAKLDPIEALRTE